MSSAVLSHSQPFSAILSRSQSFSVIPSLRPLRLSRCQRDFAGVRDRENTLIINYSMLSA